MVFRTPQLIKVSNGFYYDSSDNASSQVLYIWHEIHTNKNTKCLIFLCIKPGVPALMPGLSSLIIYFIQGS